ncbi:MAG: PAS domain S-box protein [Anaeromyxobacter sp.]|nr:PAS domain S-box protein [Anaeromyxobacter sp.]MBL0275077.1 PAS domain S-box protein [Anaeromyxobacter sp.]
MSHTVEAVPSRPAPGEAEAADGFWLVDREGRFLDVSQSYCELSGYTRDELLGMRISDLEARESAAEVSQHLERLRQQGWDRFETHHRRKDGLLLELEVAANYFAREGKLFVFLRDLTQRNEWDARRRADLRRHECLERLARSRGATLRELLDRALEESLVLTGSALGYIYYYDEDRREFTLHSWSQSVMRACSIPDMQRVYALDKTGLWGEVVRQRRPVVVNAFAAPHPHKKGYPLGHAALTRFLTVPVVVDGRIVAVAGAANKADPYDDEDVRQLGLYMDAVWQLSSRDRAEELRTKLSAVLEQTSASVVIFDAAGIVEYANERHLEQVGLPREAVLGRPFDQLQAPAVTAEQSREIWGRLLAGEPWAGELSRPGRDGRPAWQAVSVVPVRQGSRVITHFASIAEDVTERRRLEGALRHSQKLESLGTLAGGVAHDFNNILTGLVGLVGAAREALGDNHPVSEDLDEAMQLVDRATGLTRGLLAFGRRVGGQPRLVELGEVVEGVARMLRRIIGEEVRLLVTPAPGRLPVRGDRGQLEQVLINLATNARDAMAGRGDLEVTLAEVALDAAAAALHQVPPGPYAVLSVRDHGAGLDEATRARIFDPFFTTKAAGRGTGLGLSIVHGIVRGSGGFVEVWSEPGQGARFDVHLPLLPGATEEAVAAAPPLAARGHGELVLLAEDDATVRGVWASLLRRHGYRVTTAEDGEQAVAAVRAASEPFDLALLDVTMPRLTGVEAYERIRALDPRLRVLFASGYAADRVQRGTAAARERLLAKPLAPAALLAEVRSALDRPVPGAR